MPEYTVLTVIGIIGVVVLELAWFKTGIFTTLRYWITMVIVFGFQIPVDGWLTKLSNPIVIYDPDQMLGVRAPWDIPIEDFGFGFSMVTLAILLWRRWNDPQRRRNRKDNPARTRQPTSTGSARVSEGTD